MEIIDAPSHLGNDVIDKLVKFKNIWVDTLFQSLDNIRRLISTFGPEKGIYVSDWPYGRRPPAILAVKTTCQGDTKLEELLFSKNARALMKLIP